MRRAKKTFPRAIGSSALVYSDPNPYRLLTFQSSSPNIFYFVKVVPKQLSKSETLNAINWIDAF